MSNVNGKRVRSAASAEEESDDDPMSTAQMDDLFGVASATRSRAQGALGPRKARSTAGVSGGLSIVANTGVGSSRDMVDVNVERVAEAARAQLQQNDELGQLVVRYLDSFHGSGSVHARGLRSDEYLLMTLVARSYEWQEMDGTTEASQPTHGKFKARTGQQVPGLADTVRRAVQGMVLAAREGCMKDMADAVADKAGRAADGGRGPGGVVGQAGGAEGPAVAAVALTVKGHKPTFVGHFLDESRVTRLSQVEGESAAKGNTAVERVVTVHEEVTVATGNIGQKKR